MAVALPAAAQEKNSLALGGSFTLRGATDSEAHAGNGIGLDWRLGHSPRGWGWDFGFGWYSADIDRLVGGRTLELGELRIRPVLAGYAYTFSLSQKIAVKASLMGGFALTTFDLTPEARDALRPPGGGSVDVGAGFTPILKPSGGLWYDLNDRWGLGVTVGFTVAHPTVTFRTSAGRDSRRIDADTLAISTGLVYRIF